MTQATLLKLKKTSAPTSVGVERFEQVFLAITAIIAGLALVFMSLKGPLWLNDIAYKTSPSGETQTIALDLVNLVFLAPVLIAGGVLHLRGKQISKYLLILPPIYLMYNGLSYGIGMEWSSTAYSGNSEQYFGIFLLLIVAGLVMLMGSLSLFSETDEPQFNRKNLRVYVILVTLFLLVFAMMWFDEVVQVINTGDTLTGSYSASPTVFWVVRYLDLGFSIPLGLIGMYLLWNRTKKAYPVVLLFFGFFVTQITAVLAMAILMLMNQDPEMHQGGLVVFSALAILVYSGFVYLIKDKIR